MRTLPEIDIPELFSVQEHLSDQINCNIIQSEIDGGVYLRDLKAGDTLEIETQDWTCTLVYRGDHQASVSGHPLYCPAPVLVYITGSTWGGSMLKLFYIGRGMHMEFLHPAYERILTSPVVDIRAMAAQE